MKVPFPNISANLAVNSHMYVCIESGDNKKFLSCQTKKPKNIAKTNPPFIFIAENNDINRNPFRRPTLIGCDYAFGMENIHIDSKLLARSRRDICQEIHNEILNKINHPSFYTEPLNIDDLLSMNKLMSKKNISQVS